MALRLSRRIALGALTLWGLEAGMYARQRGDFHEDDMARVLAGVVTVGLACSPTKASMGHLGSGGWSPCARSCHLGFPFSSWW